MIDSAPTPTIGSPMVGKALYPHTRSHTLLSISLTVIYEQIQAGRLRAVKQGHSRLVPATAIADHVALLEREAPGSSRR
jgi:excisionase family DNA binding protein